jgi:hypothetical protein
MELGKNAWKGITALSPKRTPTHSQPKEKPLLLGARVYKRHRAILKRLAWMSAKRKS